MDTEKMMLIIGIASIFAISGIIAIIFVIRAISKRHRCYPFKYGGFGKDNDYEDWTRRR